MFFKGMLLLYLFANTNTINRKFYIISNVYDWQKTGDTNMALIEALDDVDVVPNPEP